ncbi:UDP-N-acetylmuramate dehydrogenase [Candidatus Saccharibacteria bacterium]|nr:UDP-N-acetylmuramate dehydrogenase [Candidatus Saccharibacteria bacterium]
MRLNENILISSLTTMSLGGPARYVLEVETPRDIADAYGFARTLKLPTFVLGYGANTIGRDEGFNGVIIINRMQGMFEEPIENGIRLKIMGGEYWDHVVEYACNKGLTGIEALSKIPGLTGAAPVQNIGAYGQQISDVLTEIEVFDTQTDSVKTLSHDELQFSYRHSILNTTEYGRYFVISITLELHVGVMPRPFYNSIETFMSDHALTDFSPAGIRAVVSAIRTEKLPDPSEKASAGSFFKNIYLSETDAETAESNGIPIRRGDDGIKINSAWLIEQCHLKGKLLHGFRVSKSAPLVLINESAQSYADLNAARAEIVNKVYDKFGYWLEQEPVEIVNAEQPNPAAAPGTTPIQNTPIYGAN